MRAISRNDRRQATFGRQPSSGRRGRCPPGRSCQPRSVSLTAVVLVLAPLAGFSEMGLAAPLCALAHGLSGRRVVLLKRFLTF